MDPLRKKPWFRFSQLLTKRIATQITALAGLSLVLGSSFNAANPIGIRWGSSSNPAMVGNPGVQKSAEPAISSAAPTSQTTVAPTPDLLPSFYGTSSSPATPPREPFPELSWTETKQLVAEGKVVLVDVRGKPTYDAGHIPGAVSLQEWSTPAEIQVFQQKYGPATALVLYCGNLACPASEDMAKKLVADRSCRRRYADP